MTDMTVTSGDRYEDPSKEFHPVEHIEPKCMLNQFLDVPFPREAFPTRIRAICDHLHDVRGTPIEMLYFCAIGIVAGVAGDHFKATGTFKDHEQFPNQYFLGIGESSSGKSTALEPLLKHLQRKEDEKHRLYKYALKNNPETKDTRFMIANATSEAIAIRMAQTENAIFSITAEGRQVFDIIGGAYKNGRSDGISLYNSGWSGEGYYCDRVQREEVYISRAFISALWLVQPDILNSLILNETNIQSGFVARLFPFRATAPLQYDVPNSPPQDKSIVDEWGRFICELCDARDSATIMIRATPEAKIIFSNYYNRYVDIQNAIGEYALLVSKSCEKACRLALTFAICDERTIIDETLARNACSVVDYSNGIILESQVSKYNIRVEEGKNKIINFFTKRNTTRLTAGQFAQFSNITLADLEHAAKEYPSLFTLKHGKTNGTAIIYTPPR